MRLLTLVLVASCTVEPMTYQDVAETIAVTYCDKVQSCGVGAWDTCYRFSVSDTCSAVDCAAEYRGSLDVCLSDIAAVSCSALSVPASCSQILQ